MTKRQRIEAYLDRLSSGTAPEPDRARAHRRPANDRPGGHRALRQTHPGPAATHTHVPAAGEWPPQPPPMTGTEPRRPSTRGRLRPVPEPDRQPPHNLEAEEAVLGAVLTAGRLLAEVAAVLEEADFYRPAHRAIWRAILRLADRGQPTDPVTVLGELDHSRRAGRCRRRPVPAHPGRGRAHRGQRRPLRPAGRRGGAAPAGDRPRHPPGPLRRRPGRARPSRWRAGRHHHRGIDGRGWAPPIPFGATGGYARLPGRGAARLARRVRGGGRHRHPDPTGSGRHARPGRARHRRRRRRRGPTPTRLARAAVPVRGRGHGRRGPQEQRLHRPHPTGRRLRTRAGHRRPPGDHRDHHPAAHRRPGRRPRRGRRQQGPRRPAGGAAGRGDRPGRRGRQPDRAAGAAVAGR